MGGEKEGSEAFKKTKKALAGVGRVWSMHQVGFLIKSPCWVVGSIPDKERAGGS